MTSARHRVALYWLLLILPAVAVGAGALALLRREQARVEAQAEAARVARETAVLERARLTAENLEVLLTEVQHGLAETLRSIPRGAERAELEGLPASNALVADIFAVSSRGTLLWGAARESTRQWLAQQATGEIAEAELAMPDAALTQYRVAKDETAVVGNSLDFAKARGALQIESRQRAMKAAEADAVARREERELSAQAMMSEPASAFAPEPRVVTWSTSGQGESVQVFGTMEAPNGTQVGVSLELNAVLARLREAMPADVGAEERYFLVATGHDAMFKSDAGARGSLYIQVETPVARAPLSAALLPGWRIDGYWAGASERADGGATGFVLGGLLVVLFVAAILAGGTLLLRDARRSEVEAQQRTSFVSHVSHEFKTPLTTIRMYAELLAQGRVREAAKQQDYLGVIGRETERLTRLVNNALDFGRLEQGAHRLAVQDCDLAAELRTLGQTQEPRLAEAGLALQLDLPAGPQVGRADRDALQHIVLNLLDNAVKYAAEGGEVLVALRPSAGGAGADIVVADRGPGVAPADRERMFGQFARLDESLTAERLQGGAGLGLSIARALARRMGGDLRCEGRDGGGAQFVLTMP